MKAKLLKNVRMIVSIHKRNNDYFVERNDYVYGHTLQYDSFEDANNEYIRVVIEIATKRFKERLFGEFYKKKLK